MKADLPNDPSQEPRLDQNDPVWRLLGRAPLRQPDGWFTARTLARCRHAGLAEPAWTALGTWRWALGGIGVLCLALVLAAPRVHSVSIAHHQKESVQEAFQIVASLDTIDSDPSSTTSASSWQDSSL